MSTIVFSLLQFSVAVFPSFRFSFPFSARVCESGMSLKSGKIGKCQFDANETNHKTSVAAAAAAAVGHRIIRFGSYPGAHKMLEKSCVPSLTILVTTVFFL